MTKQGFLADLREFPGGPENVIARQGACPRCKAQPGELCTSLGRKWKWFSHLRRWPGGLSGPGITVVRSRQKELEMGVLMGLGVLVSLLGLLVYEGPGWFALAMWFGWFYIGYICVPIDVLRHRARTGELLPPRVSK